MKYLAILKDSLLEALDTKVFYVMVGLSCLVLLAVGSVSYQPVTIEEEAGSFAKTLTWILSLDAKTRDKAPGIEASDFHETRPEAPPSERDYRFTLTARFPSAEAARSDIAGRLVSPGKLRFFLRQHFDYLKEIDVTQVAAPDPAEQRFEVTTHGSKVKRAEEWPHEPTVFFALAVPLIHRPVGRFVHFWEDTIINSVGAGVALLISTIITAFFIPNMLRKGTVDLLLVKPIHRSTLLVYKYVGGLAFMFLNTTFVVAGVWLILGLRTGMWGPGFLASIPVLTFQFALYYAVSTLVGVITRSSIAAILVACLAWFVFSFVLGNGYTIIDATRKLPELVQQNADDDRPPPIKPFPDWVYTSADVVHFVTPRLKDLDVLTNKLIVDDTMPPYSNERKAADKLFASFNWGEALTVTVIYIVVLLAASCWWFATKDY